MTVTNVSELRDALAKRDNSVVIDNPEIERKFAKLEFWQGREGTYRWIALLMAVLAIFAISWNLKIEASLLHDWKLERTEGKLTLTPIQK